MRTSATVSCFAMAQFERKRDGLLNRLVSTYSQPVRFASASPAAPARPSALNNLSRARPKLPMRRHVYVVDDLPLLTNLYATLLEEAGFAVKAFNDRRSALAILSRDEMPSFLITDYVGSGMPIRPFMCQCRTAHPNLRILMASGFDQREMRLCDAAPDQFLQKPFTVEEFHRAIRATLGGKQLDT